MQGKNRLRIIAVLLCAALMMALGAITASAEGEVWFTAIGDTLLPLSESTMPIERNGEYYLPYTVFSGSALGIRTERDVSNYTLTFSSDFASITFDSLRGFAYDEENRYEKKLAGRNGTVYFPAAFVCDYFGLDFQVIHANPKDILRIAGSGSMSASAFLNSVSTSLAQRYMDYSGGGSTPSPATPTPTPSGGGVTPAPTPTPTPEPTPTPTPTPPPEPVEVYLTFDDGPNRHTELILDTLDDFDLRAAFFLTGSLIEDPARQDTVRRMAGSGHTVGVHAYTHRTEEMYVSAEALTAELERANDALQQVTGMRTRLFRFPYGSAAEQITEGMRDAVVAAGYRYWDWNIDAEDYSQPSPEALAESVIRDLDRAAPGSRAVILMHDTETTAAALPAILEHITNGNFRVRTVKLTDDPVNFFNDIR